MSYLTRCQLFCWRKTTNPTFICFLTSNSIKLTVFHDLLMLFLNIQHRRVYVYVPHLQQLLRIQDLKGWAPTHVHLQKPLPLAFNSALNTEGSSGIKNNFLFSGRNRHLRWCAPNTFGGWSHPADPGSWLKKAHWCACVAEYSLPLLVGPGILSVHGLTCTKTAAHRNWLHKSCELCAGFRLFVIDWGGMRNVGVK